MDGRAVGCGRAGDFRAEQEPSRGTDGGSRDIFIHEFAHGIHGAVRRAGGDFDSRLRAAYEQAMDEGLWENAYAANNHSEYWAEAVQCWFDDNRENDALHEAGRA